MRWPGLLSGQHELSTLISGRLQRPAVQNKHLPVHPAATRVYHREQQRFRYGGGGMKRFKKLNSITAAALFAALCSATNALPVAAQEPPVASAAVPQAGSFLLTVFLRHDQTKTVEQINEHLKQTGWYDKFPPDGVEIVAWYVMMGIGQVIILRVPAEKLRDTNRVTEQA